MLSFHLVKYAEIHSYLHLLHFRFNTSSRRAGLKTTNASTIAHLHQRVGEVAHLNILLLDFNAICQLTTKYCMRQERFLNSLIQTCNLKDIGEKTRISRRHEAVIHGLDMTLVHTSPRALFN